MKKYIILIFSLFVTQAFADDWFAKQRDTFGQFSETSNNIYKSFLDKNDAEFVRWLRQQWKVYKRFEARSRDATPKPETQPALDKAVAVMSNGEQLKSSAALQKNIPTFQKKEPPLQKGKQVNILYYGHSLKMPVPVGLRTLLIKKVEANSLADAFEFVAKLREQSIINTFTRIQNDYQLSDWAMVQLVQHYTEVLYPPGAERSFLNWYLLSKLTYQAQMGIVLNQLMVLMPAQQLVYGRPYYMIKGEAYYPVGDYIDGDLQTYPGQYSAQNKSLDLRFNKTLLAGEVREQRLLKWQEKLQGKKLNHQIEVSFNPYRVQYFKGYPQIDLSFYFDAPVDSYTAKNLKQKLQPMLLGEAPRQQVNLLLAFVQQSFTYKMDQVQFGEENYLLPEETLSYPASDCEDRAFLFAWLVRELVDLPMVGVTYPGHVAVAVAFKGEMDVNDKWVAYQGRRYTLTDPTYLGSNAGQMMVQYRNIKPEIVPIL